MPSFINKTVMVLLLCLIFIGQSMASMTMLYDMTAMQASTQSMANMSSMKSAHHDMSDMADCDDDMMTTSTMTCSSTTAQDCDCLTSGCSTASAFSAIMHYSPNIAISSKITSITTIVTSQALTSLYRPPILS